MNVLLLGGGLQGLSFGESLYRQCQVSVVSDEYAIRKSRFFNHVYHKGKLDSLALIKSILSGNHFDVIVPMSDRYASLLSKNKTELQNEFSVKCAVPDYDTLSIVENKSTFMAFCEQHGIPHPKTVSLSQNSIKDSYRAVGFPALIKPDYSVGARGIVRVNNNNELETLLPEIEKEYGSCSLQEFIDNSDYYFNVMMYRDAHGDITNYTVIKILRMYPVKGGSSSYCVSVNNDTLVSICRDALDKLNWTGMADFDVLQRKDTGAYRIIEINPRVPASLRAAFVSGVNFPHLIVQECSGVERHSYNYEPGKALRYMGLDIMWLIRSPQRKKYLVSWFRFWDEGLYYQDIFKSDKSTWYSWAVTGIRKLFVRSKN